ncbi:NADPH-dependent FMN reductase [Sansalvadorimonas verongulae]|uniref:NADPH-dependent FMN reductase n=1 Tax=Sansalvadorimonas verongulae TaxID=2172824 RepID=UPI0012BB9F89|nr:NAD(P)H-dependent oxidoreductase [Sansalvadorimonas verongulae]MTI14764.1 NADPH-dependent oxidoreductase [Sansalvadorimonas verongulae]
MHQVLVIAASQQKASQSRKVADYINHQVENLGANASVLDLGKTVLPLWSGEPAPDKSLINTIRDQLNHATSFVFVVPEWNGMAPPAIKNLLTWFGADQFAHKPVLLCAVSAGQGGAFVISELRGSSYKNCRICYLPEHLIIRSVGNVLEGVSPMGKSDNYYRNRIDFVLKDLLDYDLALSTIRPHALERMEDFPNGMS